MNREIQKDVTIVGSGDLTAKMLSLTENAPASQSQPIGTKLIGTKLIGD